MINRRFVLAAAAALGLAACATSPAAAPFVSERVTITTQGAGPDVILIPGLTSNPRIWAGTVAAFPQYRFHLVQVHGFSGTPAGANADGPVSAPVAEEIARYIAERRLANPAVIGHSMGGSIAMMVAARHPDAVGRTMVVDMMPFMGAMFGPPGATSDSVRPVADQIRAAMQQDAPEAQRRAMAEQTIAGMIATEAERPAAVNDSVTSDPKTVANAFHELVVTDLRPELAKINGPLTVLYVQPTGAPLTEAQIDAYYRMSYATAPGAVVKRIPNARHFIMFDQKAAFEDEVRAFMAR
ncbi:MAG: alpha/beta hydrolase [Hyphomonadaceae bacterium]|nr:alpha/beta hydrolase [Hyphomonadaceae bacterium]